MKQKYLRANQGRFMTKDLHKAIMKRSRLRNKFVRYRTDISRDEYKKQRNLCVCLLKKAKKDHKMEKLGKPIFNFKFASHEETKKEVNKSKKLLKNQIFL